MVHPPKLLLANVYLGNICLHFQTQHNILNKMTLRSCHLHCKCNRWGVGMKWRCPEGQQRGFSKLPGTEPPLVKRPVNGWPSEPSTVPGTERRLTSVSADEQQRVI